MLSFKTIHIIFFSTIFILLLSPNGFSQDSLEEKLDKIKDRIDRITITSNGVDITFEGKEAEKLFNRMKGHHTFVFKDEGDKKNKKIIIKSDDDTKIFEFDDDNDFSWFGDENGNSGVSKRIKVEMKDGKKKVTVTTMENGEEKTEVYEGDEANEYLDKLKSNDDSLEFNFNDDDGKNMKKIIIEKETRNSTDK